MTAAAYSLRRGCAACRAAPAADVVTRLAWGSCPGPPLSEDDNAFALRPRRHRGFICAEVSLPFSLAWSAIWAPDRGSRCSRPLSWKQAGGDGRSCASSRATRELALSTSITPPRGRIFRVGAVPDRAGVLDRKSMKRATTILDQYRPARSTPPFLDFQLNRCRALARGARECTATSGAEILPIVAQGARGGRASSRYLLAVIRRRTAS